MLRVGAEALCSKSSIEAVSTVLISNIRRALPWLCAETVALLKRPVTEMCEGDVLPLLRAILKDCRARPNTSSGVAYTLSSSLRTLLTSGPDTLLDGASLRESIEKYRPHLREPDRVLPNSPLLADIAKQPHVDWDDLRQKANALVRERRSAIEKAVSNEFDAYERLVMQQVGWLRTTVSPQSKRRVTAWLDSNLPPKDRVDLSSIPIQDIAAVLLQRQVDEAAPLDANGWPRWDHAVPECLASLDQFKEYRFKMSSAPWSHARIRLPNPVLTAIFLAILNYTGWNQGSVGELIVSDISVRPQGGYRLQGYKGKTDDSTPVVEVPASARLTCKAIKLLLWNHQQLQGMGLIAPTEQRVWFGWQSDGFKLISNFAAWARIINFCTRHRVERFNASDLRPLAAAAIYLPQRDLEAVRILLGHKSLQMSDAYLQNTLFFRMNEANMLQFQRRIETSLVFSTGGLAQVKRHRLHARDIDPTLFVPTGDGGACINPLEGHPDEPLKPDEPCSGLHCQRGEGCPNYRLHIDAKTIEMALRTRLYYRARWADLARANLAAFTRIHLPRLLFMHVLLTIVHERRPDLLKKAQEALT